MVVEVALKLGVDLRDAFDLVLDLLHVLRAVVHLRLHFCDLPALVLLDLLHSVVDFLLALLKLLVLLLQIDEAVAQPVDLLVRVGLARLASL